MVGKRQSVPAQRWQTASGKLPLIYAFHELAGVAAYGQSESE
jgi:hypothetical protein